MTDGAQKDAPTGAATPKPALGEQLTLIDPAPFSPSSPTANTLPERLLWVLLSGASIDHPEFEDATGSWRLAAHVRELRALGWPVETVALPSPTDEAPERTIARYRLPPDAIGAGRELLARGGA